MYKLIIQDDEGKTTVVPLIRDEISIGRKEGNTIRLTERNVSRRHARLLKANGSVVLEDLESYNGIRVNGARIQGKVTVAETDRIQIGDYLLELKVDRATAGPNDATAEHKPVDPAAVPATGEQVATARTLTGAPAPGAAPPAATPNGVAEEPTVKVEGPTPPMGGQAAAVPAMPARLVCLSSNFAGREFKLDKSAMVIGRTEDNDVVINHRSISRHHAKLARDGARYSIVDLQSSNGVRVNGEEYGGKVDLRKADLIDLGHVRLRFVEPGEDFVFHRDATVVDLSLEGKKSKLPLIIALLVFLGGAVALYFVIRGNGDETVEPPKNPVVANAAADAAPPPRSPPDAGVAIAPAVSEEVAAKLAAAKKAIDAQDWSTALASADAAMKKDPENAEAKRFAELARREAEAQTAFETVGRALTARKVEEAAAAFAQIPEDSVYRAKAQAKVDPAVAKWVDEQKNAARAAADGGKCERIAGIRDKVAQLAPDRASDIERQRDRCIANRDKPDPGPGVVKPPQPTGDPAALLEEAKQLYGNGQFELARAKADKVLALRPGDPSALSYATLASCRLGRADMAKRYASRLDAARRDGAAKACEGMGVVIK